MKLRDGRQVKAAGDSQDAVFATDCHKTKTPWHFCKLCKVPLNPRSVRCHEKSATHKAAGEGAVEIVGYKRGADVLNNQFLPPQFLENEKKKQKELAVVIEDDDSQIVVENID